MGRDARVELPPLEDSDPVKAEVYRIRGETVSIGGSVEWIIGSLASQFACSTAKGTERQWEDLKAHIMSQGLTSRLQREFAAVAEYFTPRNLAAHAAIVIAHVGETSQIFRLYHENRVPQAKQVTLEELRAESTTARNGYKAIQAIGRALDVKDPAVLAGMNQIAKAMLLNRI